MEFKDDIFISYSSLDAPWAIKLEQSLMQSGLKVFRDGARLIPGREWEEQLYEALKTSKHIIVLWSNNARESDWVTKETSYFDVNFYENQERKFIGIVLNDQPKTFNRLQSITQVRNKSIDQVDSQTWDTVIKGVLEGIKANDIRRPIRRAILTLTNAELMALNFDYVPAFGYSLNQLGLDKQKIKDRYGPSRNDWKPLDGKKKITDILDEILDAINSDNKLTYRWLPANEQKLYSRNDRRQVIAEKQLLENELSVIVVDPIALYDDTYRVTFSILTDCLKNKDTLIMSFPLFEPSDVYAAWRKAIESCANAFHARYFTPPIPKDQIIGRFSANPIDNLDARHFIQDMLSGADDNLSDGAQPKPKPPQVSHQ
jgi:hypothetical protein